MKGRTRKAGFLLGVFLLCQLSACGMFTKPVVHSQEENRETEDAIVVGFSQIGSESLWRTANTNSLQEELSKDNGFFLIYKNARQKQENQIKAIREFISQRVDYIVFSPVTEKGWDNVLLEAKEAGIPVIIIDRKVDVTDESLYMTWIGSNMVEEGRKAGEWLARTQKEKNREEEPLNIVMLLGTEGATATIGREEGFLEVAKKHENWKILEQVSADFTTAKGKEVMAELLQKHPEIDVVISQNDDMTFGALDANKESGRTVGENGDIETIISFDATRPALSMTGEGKISLSVECNPLQGSYVRNVILQKEMGFTIHKNYFVDEEIFTKENALTNLGERTY